MKKLFLLLSFPFIFKAQTPSGKDSSEARPLPLPVEKTASADNPKEQTKQLLESYRQRVLKGENFGTLARQYSQDPGSAKNGGTYSNIARGTMVPEFEETANRLKPGEISEVFETQYGFHFMQLIARNGDTYNVRHILLLFPK